MPRFEPARVAKMHIGRHQPFCSGAFQTGLVPLAGQHPQLVVARKALDGCPPDVLFGITKWIASDSRKKNFHQASGMGLEWAAMNLKPFPDALDAIDFPQ